LLRVRPVGKSGGISLKDWFLRKKSKKTSGTNLHVVPHTATVRVKITKQLENYEKTTVIDSNCVQRDIDSSGILSVFREPGRSQRK
jgi:hypothetical protein